jgi:ABC-type antimicrobial peptide transport system permease subunit
MGLGMKLLTILGIVLAVIFAYVLMLAMQPATNTIIATANASTGNWTVTPEFEMAQGVINSFPVWQWILPGFIGLFAIVMIWRSP